MSFTKKLFLFDLIIFSLCLTACCECGSSSDEGNLIKGSIIIVGNEPFTKLAIRTGEDKTYVLQCSNELKEMLWKRQGEDFVVQYEDIRTVEGYKTLIVAKVVPINKKTNK